MKKAIYWDLGKLSLLILIVLLTRITFAGTFTNIQEPMGVDTGVYNSSIVYGDYDNDGDLDIALTGYDATNYRFIIYRNDAGTFTNVQEPIGANKGFSYSSITFGDIDNDGDLDIALTASDKIGNGRFIIYRNDAGTFTNVQEPMGADQGVYKSSIALGDIDNDGDLDIALTGYDGTNYRFILYRNDAGTFNLDQEPIGTDQGFEYSSIAFGDIDNDGDLDIALTGNDNIAWDRRFIIYRNDAGTFILDQEPMGVNKGFAYSSTVLGDIDNDGDLDLAITGYDDVNYRFVIYRNDAGTFNLDQEPMGADEGVRYSSIAFGDYDNDGDLDLALTGNDDTDTRFITYRNDAGTFNLDQEPMGADEGVHYSSIAFGDIDNDGDLDLAITGDDGTNNRFIIYRNDEITVNDPPTVPTGMSTTEAGGYWGLSWDQSIDDHTDPDALRYQIAIGTGPNYYNYTSTSINYPRGQANLGKVMETTGTPYYQTKFPITRKIYWKVCAIDSAFKHSAYSSEQTQIPKFSLVQEPMGADQGVYLSSIAYGDYDNDGDLDLAVTGNDGSNHRFMIYRNDAGVFNLNQEPMGVNKGVWQSSIAFGDYDNDGDLDIALTGEDGSNHRFMIYRNDAGVFNLNQEPMGVDQGVQVSSIAFGDYDNDGDPDIAVTGNDGSNRRFMIYRNDAGTFILDQEPMGADQGVYGSSIAYGDYDNDGDLDIALTGYDNIGWEPRFIIYRNDAGTFILDQEPMGANQGVQLSSIAYGDIDSDGDLDIALIGYGSSGYRFMIYRNDAGTFTNVQEPMGAYKGVRYSSIAFGDIDSDGDLDIALTGDDEVNYRFMIYRNDAGTFTKVHELMGPDKGVRRSSISFGDIDNDGDLDIALTGNDGANYRFIIYRNEQSAINNPPGTPTGMLAADVGGYWKLSWDQSTDDLTDPDALRYQIAIGTGPNYYNYTGTSIDYPRGQANIGKVMLVAGTPYYQTDLAITQAIYWKVCALDSAFIYSNYSSEQFYEIFAISGNITDGINPLPYVIIDLTGSSTASTITDASGNYSFNNLISGATYTITPTLKNYSFTPADRVYTDLNGDITDADFTGTKMFAADLKNVKVYPNPWKSDTSVDKIAFANLTENSNIKIYGVNGSLIFEKVINNIEYLFDLKNTDGEEISAGVYIYLITNDRDEKKIGKFAIIK